MEPVASAVDRVKSLAKSTEDFIKYALRGSKEDSRRDDPVEILKRLQREAFSDLMKLRDRQDKIERMISFPKTNNRNPFQDAGTRVKGMIGVAGAWLFADANSEQYLDMLSKAGIRIGVDSRFIFETTVRQKDTVTAELIANSGSAACDDDSIRSPLALAKVTYLASISDWLSVSAIPMGAQCWDLMGHEHHNKISLVGPPVFSQYHNCAAAVRITRSKITTALAGLVSTLHRSSGSSPDCLATFGQCSYQPSEGTKFTFSGLWQMPRSPFRKMKIGALAIPIFNPKQRLRGIYDRQSSVTRPVDAIGGSIALMLDSELDESTKIGVWVQKNHLEHVQWSVSLTDLPDNELGWGLSVGGTSEGRRSHVHLGGFLNFNVGNRFNLQPGLTFAMGDSSQKPVITLRTNWGI